MFSLYRELSATLIKIKVADLYLRSTLLPAQKINGTEN